MDVILVGPTGAGKSTIMSKLANCGFTPILEYTTRPMREKERNGVDYHFVNDATYNQMEAGGKFVEHKSFNTVHGVWKYGALKEDFGHNPGRIITMGPEQVKQIINAGVNVFIIFLDVQENEVMKRISGRGDNTLEVRRRIKTDRDSYQEVKEYADCIIDTTNMKPDTITKLIIEAVDKKQKAYIR